MLATLQNVSLRASYAFLAFAAAPNQVAAQIFGPVPDIGGVGSGGTDAVRQGILDVLEIVLAFMALIAVIFIVVAGIRLVVSQGEETEKDKAKKTILYVVIGLIVILIAQAVVSFINDVAANVD